MRSRTFFTITFLCVLISSCDVEGGINSCELLNNIKSIQLSLGWCCYWSKRLSLRIANNNHKTAPWQYIDIRIHFVLNVRIRKRRIARESEAVVMAEKSVFKYLIKVCSCWIKPIELHLGCFFHFLFRFSFFLSIQMNVCM